MTTRKLELDELASLSVVTATIRTAVRQGLPLDAILAAVIIGAHQSTDTAHRDDTRRINAVVSAYREALKP